MADRRAFLASLTSPLLASCNFKDGAPILESRAAIMVADIDSECVLADGRWQFARHLVKPLFVGGEGPTLPPASNLVPGK